MQTQSVVADRYLVPYYNGAYQKEAKTLSRKGMVVLPSYVKEVNEQNGSYLFVIDEEATQAHIVKMAELSEARGAKKVQNNLKKADIINVLVEKAAAASKLPKNDNLKAPNENTPDEELDVKQLRAKYPQLTSGNKAQMLKKIKELNLSAVAVERKTLPPAED